MKAMDGKSLRNKGAPLDIVDRKLLQALTRNARVTLARLARLVGLSAPSVAERLRRLEETGVVLGYRVEIDPAALGRPFGVVIRVRPIAGELHRVAAMIQESPEIVECHRITGDDCFIAIAFLADVQALETLIDRLAALAQTNTSLIQSSPVKRRMPVLA
jgi:Lrp/AsnC family transcriptional regulator, leucine-responsive regulatory protein